MKHYILGLMGLAVLASCYQALALTTTDQAYQMDNQMGGVANQVQLGTRIQQAEKVDGAYSTVQRNDATLLKRIVRATYNADSTVVGDSTVNSSTLDSGLHGLGITIPGKAIITRSFFEVVTPFTSAGGAATVAFQCETANNIFSATDIDPKVAGSFVEGVSSGASTVFKKITSDCEVSAKVGVEDLTAGKAIVFVEYVISE